MLLIEIASKSYWLWLPGVSPADRLPNFAYSVAVEPLIPAGVAVSAWITLRVSGKRHADEDWRGSVGKVTSCLWVLLALAESALFLPDILQNKDW